MDMNSDHKPYASGRLRALVTMLLLAACAAASVLSIVVNVALAGMLRGGGDHGEPYEIGESLTELLYVGVALLQLFVFIATVAAFLLWLHRAYRNLRALGATGLDTTPGWAVAYFFIPVLNLFRPFQVVKEIWRWSAPRVAETESGFGNSYSRPKVSALVGWWWAFWIIATAAERASNRIIDRAGTIEGMLLASWAAIASHVLFIVAAVLAILVVSRIDEMQDTKFRQLREQSPPPPPDNFETPGRV